MTLVDLGLPGLDGVADVPRSDASTTAEDYKSDQDVRWCPGCGDYAVLAAVRSFLPSLGLRRENIVFISGIGCSSRFPYYLNTYGLHSIHGRAPAIATGLAISRPDLSVWVVTGDGDALSIGGNHLIHALRRNVNVKILLFNNRIYGLTKGQASPTSEQGKVTKSTPAGSVDAPFNPISLALGAEATFVARALDSDRRGLPEVLGAAARHRGAALVEIYQNCPVFNDGAFDLLRQPGEREQRIVPLRDGELIVFGANHEFGLAWDRKTGGVVVTKVDEVDAEALLVHDAAVDDPTYAFALSRVSAQDLSTTVTGIFRSVRRPTTDELLRSQINRTQRRREDLIALLRGQDSWVRNTDVAEGACCG